MDIIEEPPSELQLRFRTFRALSQLPATVDGDEVHRMIVELSADPQLLLRDVIDRTVDHFGPEPIVVSDSRSGRERQRVERERLATGGQRQRRWSK